jgi:hypothetical protein
VAGNLARARELLDGLDAQLKEAEAASADAAQDYFRAAAVLEQVRKDQAEALGLLKPVGECLQQLAQAQQDCDQRRRELGALAQKVQAYLAGHDRVVGEQARSFLGLAERKRADAASGVSAARPNWPALRQQLDAARHDYEAALGEMEKDVERHRQLTAKLDEVGREAERVGAWLRGRREDRPRANQRHRAAADLLEQVRRQSAAAGADWGRLLQQAEEAARALKQAHELAQEDLRLAQQAEAELAEADREIARAGGYSNLGIGADVSQAADLLARARRLMAEQAYEQVIEQANAAERAARAAHDEAVRRAEQKRQRLDHERRQRELAGAAALAGGVAAATAAASARRPDPAPASSVSDWSAGSEPSATSTSGESSQSSW